MKNKKKFKNYRTATFFWVHHIKKPMDRVLFAKIGVQPNGCGRLR